MAGSARAGARMYAELLSEGPGGANGGMEPCGLWTGGSGMLDAGVGAPVLLCLQAFPGSQGHEGN